MDEHREQPRDASEGRDLRTAITPPPDGHVQPPRRPRDAGWSATEGARGVQVGGGGTEILFGTQRRVARRTASRHHDVRLIVALLTTLLAAGLMLELSRDAGWIERVIRLAPIVLPSLGG